MNQSPEIQKPVLAIDLKIRFQSRVYRISLAQAARWIVPLAVLIARVISYLRSNSSS